MRSKQCERSGRQTVTARNSESRKKHIADANRIQFLPAPLCEAQLCAASWQNPAELLRVADATGLDVHDFCDRACGASVGYLRLCGERSESPTIGGAVQFLREHGATCDVAELERIVATPIPTGDSIADLVADVQRFVSERAEADARYATQCGLTELVDFVFAVPNWRDELRDFRRWTRREKRRVAREFNGTGSQRPALRGRVIA